MYRCSRHAWSHFQKECPSCFVTTTASSAGASSDKTETEALRSQLAIAIEALEFYSKGQRSNSDEPIGTLMEFGCGCCSGVIEDSMSGRSFDDSVIGQTAREALAKIRTVRIE